MFIILLLTYWFSFTTSNFFIFNLTTSILIDSTQIITGSILSRLMLDLNDSMPVRSDKLHPYVSEKFSFTDKKITFHEFSWLSVYNIWESWIGLRSLRSYRQGKRWAGWQSRIHSGSASYINLWQHRPNSCSPPWRSKLLTHEPRLQTFLRKNFQNWHSHTGTTAVIAGPIQHQHDQLHNAI